MADIQPSSPTPIRPSQVLDPYPEPLRHLGGVRQTTHHPAAPPQNASPTRVAAAPSSFAASFQPLPSHQRRFGLPIASTLLTVLGNGVLGALMATQTVDPLLGLTIFVGWLTCGICLIVAQCLTIARSDEA